MPHGTYPRIVRPAPTIAFRYGHPLPTLSSPQPYFCTGRPPAPASFSHRRPPLRPCFRIVCHRFSLVSTPPPCTGLISAPASHPHRLRFQPRQPAPALFLHRRSPLLLRFQLHPLHPALFSAHSLRSCSRPKPFTQLIRRAPLAPSADRSAAPRSPPYRHTRSCRHDTKTASLRKQSFLSYWQHPRQHSSPNKSRPITNFARIDTAPQKNRAEVY